MNSAKKAKVSKLRRFRFTIEDANGYEETIYLKAPSKRYALHMIKNLCLRNNTKLVGSIITLL